MKVEILQSGRDALLLEDYTVKTSIGDVVIPAGFKTDFASVPQIFWSIVPPMGKYFVAAVLHDYFYRVPTSRVWDGQPKFDKPVTRKLADTIFSEEMKDAKVSWWKRQIMYRAVRIGGASSWIEPPPEEVEAKLSEVAG